MGYTIDRLSGDRDKRELLRLWNENHEKNLDAKYKWIYDGNPAGKAIVSLIKKDETNQYIGCSAAFPRRFSVDGVALRGCVAGDFFVRKEHRLIVPALKLMKRLIAAVREDEVDLLYILPNEKAEPVVERAGFRLLGSNKRIAKIIRTSEQLQEVKYCRGLSRFLSPVLDTALRISSFETWYRFTGGFVCEEISESDERFDAFWIEVKSRFQAVGERTSESLRWRFLEKPDIEYKIYAIFNSDKTILKGYIVYRMDENSISINDLVLPADQKAVRVFVSHFLRHVKRLSIKSVAIKSLENTRVLRILRKFGFVTRESDWKIYYYCNESLLKRFPFLDDSENWLFFNFDNES